MSLTMECEHGLVFRSCPDCRDKQVADLEARLAQHLSDAGDSYLALNAKLAAAEAKIARTFNPHDESSISIPESQWDAQVAALALAEAQKRPSARGVHWGKRSEMYPEAVCWGAHCGAERLGRGGLKTSGTWAEVTCKACLAKRSEWEKEAWGRE